MNQQKQDIVNEFEEKLKSGELYSCALSDLNKYLEALLVFEGSLVSKYAERASQIQTLNNLILVKTLNNVDETINNITTTIKELNKKSTCLTTVVIVLAILSFVASCIQIFLR